MQGPVTRVRLWRSGRCRIQKLYICT
jgi:hypothetical protein